MVKVMNEDVGNKKWNKIMKRCGQTKHISYSRQWLSESLTAKTLRNMIILGDGFDDWPGSLCFVFVQDSHTTSLHPGI